MPNLCGKEQKRQPSLLATLLLAIAILPVLHSSAQPPATDNVFAARLATSSSITADPALSARYNSKLKGAALLFTENRGQVADAKGALRPDILFTAHSSGAAVFLTASGIHYQFARTTFPKGYMHDPREVIDDKKQAALRKQVKMESHRFTLSLEGANPAPYIRKEEKNVYTENFYLSHCPGGITGVGTYERVVLEGVYPGIDWVIYSNGQGMKYDFIVHPGADPSLIKLKVSDAETARIAEDGRLVVTTSLGTVAEEKPISFCGDQMLETTFRRNKADGTIGFAVTGWDKAKPLIIDPTVSWATYYGDIDFEDGRACAVDASGDVYLAGQIGSNGGTSAIATVGGHQIAHGGDVYDAFLVKFNSAGVRQWGTYYGGAGDDQGLSCAVAGGDVYMAGFTATVGGNTIATGSSHQSAFGGGDNDAFLVKFNSTGTRQWSTYYGGTLTDYGFSCAATGSDVYLAGQTRSSGTAIATASSHQDAAGGNNDAFLVKFSGAGVRQWGTFYGGTSNDFGFSCAALGSDVYLTGQTGSNGGIATVNSHQGARSGSFDAFLVKFSDAGVRQWGTYYGGGGSDIGNSCATIGGDVYLAGQTATVGGTAIATAGSHQHVHGGGTNDAFLVKFSGGGARQWGTYYGGTGNEVGYSSAAAGSDVYLSGYTSTSGDTAIATAGSPQPTFGGGTNDAFLVKFGGAGTRQWGTYYGGSGNDFGYSTAAAGANVFLTGQTGSSTGIATAGSHQSTFGGVDNDAFLAKMVDVVATPEINITGNSQSIADGDATPSPADHTDFGAGITSRTFTIENTGTGSLTVTGVTLSGAAAGDFSISGAPTTVAANSTATFTINFSPTATGLRTATVNISSNDADEAAYDFAIVATSCPAITVQPTNTITCAGVAATFTVQADGPVSYQWRRAGVNITGATSSSYTLPFPTPADSNATFDVVLTPTPVIAGCASSLTSATVTLTVNRHRWTGTTSTDWTNPANWNGCGVPTATSFVEIPAMSPNMPEISSAVSVWTITSAGNVTVLPTGNFQVLGNQ